MSKKLSYIAVLAAAVPAFAYADDIVFQGRESAIIDENTYSESLIAARMIVYGEATVQVRGGNYDLSTGLAILAGGNVTVSGTAALLAKYSYALTDLTRYDEASLNGSALPEFSSDPVAGARSSLLVKDGATFTMGMFGVDGADVVVEKDAVFAGYGLSLMNGAEVSLAGKLDMWSVSVGENSLLNLQVNHENTQMSISGEGNLLVRAGALTEKTQFASSNSIAAENIKTYGGKIVDGVYFEPFAVETKTASEISADSPLTIASNGASVKIETNDAGTETQYVVLTTETIDSADESATFTVKKVEALATSGVQTDLAGTSGVELAVNEDVLAAWSFSIEKPEEASVLVMMDVGSGLESSSLRIFHRGADGSWEDVTTNTNFVSDILYADGNVSFLAKQFSDYAVSGIALSIPEPSAFGLFAGTAALAFVALRRRRRTA